MEHEKTQHGLKAEARPHARRAGRILFGMLAVAALATACGGGGDDAPAPAPAALTPRTCGVTNGSAIGGLDLSGTISYSGLSLVPGTSGTVRLDPGEVTFANPALPAATPSGNLRITLWASSLSFSGGTLIGQVVARTPLVFSGGGQKLGNGQRADIPADALSATSPSRGSYCMILTLEEFGPSACSSSDGYCIVDWYQFGASEQFQ